jgi:hypothetical protein
MLNEWLLSFSRRTLLHGVHSPRVLLHIYMFSPIVCNIMHYRSKWYCTNQNRILIYQYVEIPSYVNINIAIVSIIILWKYKRLASVCVHVYILIENILLKIMTVAGNVPICIIEAVHVMALGIYEQLNYRAVSALFY